MKTANKRAIIDQMGRLQGVIRASDALGMGISDSYLRYLARLGHLHRIGRGLFVLPEYGRTEHQGLVEVAAYAPVCIICLLSALQFHGIGTQMPHAIWVAIPNKVHVPQIRTVPIEAVRMSPASLAADVETHVLEGVPVRIFSAAKTVSDCFKFRSRVGLDVALEALKDALTKRKVTPTTLYKSAMIDRVWDVMRPYIEALQ